ncbi:class I SAM-dependent methyltransferase [Natronosporangium hydrolyticum]|uniref:Class I SAM-dependent methyltransferase n=1 Tax=Natronosporangium hydrolyticum TaxID=2811111 RepID=A0A895YBN8_9ACTN|nr:class I SAM-dependent methyltransferase [Natronosporangium hydrolyticum]QSB14851.1 class I SAM-dependent methyltransferase [Natronosporangium hydrolyticum]
MTEAAFLTATRHSYDALAHHHLYRTGTDTAAKPFDRALLAAFAGYLRQGGSGPVADVGCGPGWLTAELTELGVAAFGIDLSPEMVASARLAYPRLGFVVGSMLELPLPDGGLRGLLASYAIIHVPWQHRPQLFVEFYRALAPGGQLMLAFQVGDDHRHFDNLDGLPISLDFYRQQPDEVAELLREAGFAIRVTATREPEPGLERTRQGYLLAYRS